MICFVEGFSWNISEKFCQRLFFSFPIKTQSLAILSCHSNQSSRATGLNSIIGSPCYIWNLVTIGFIASEMFKMLMDNGR